MSAAAVDISQDVLADYARFCVECEHDPVKWIEGAYPWGVKGGVLEDACPHDWHLEVAGYIRDELQAMAAGKKPWMPIRVGVASGHGIGKSALMGMLNDWNLATLVDARGVTTANTLDQLTTKTWAEMAKWHGLSLSQPFFDWTATQLFSNEPEHRKSWAVQATAWNEQRYEAFQGLHNRGKRILVEFDEGSNIPAVIYEAIEGALTDKATQIIFIVFGNPTRNSGRFYECFGKRKKYWHTMQIDSRDVPGTNLELFDQWEKEYGEDSDFFRVRVKGVFPRASAYQFLPTPWVEEAMARQPHTLDDDPLICGIDFASGGNCSSVLYWRRGKDGKTHRPDIFTDDPNTTHFIAKCAQRLKDMQPDIIFGDAGGLGGPIIDRLEQLGFPIVGVHSSGSSEYPEQNANKRADMWSKGKMWMRDGGALWDNKNFLTELTTIEVVANMKGTLQMESKESLLKRGEPSPDVSDAFMLTHAYETTELLSVEHLEAQQTTRARMDYDQWSEAPLSDDEPEEWDPEIQRRRKRVRYEGY